LELVAKLRCKIFSRFSINIELGEYFGRFCKAMDDDFNTARGIGVLFDGVRHANKWMDNATESLSPETVSLLQTVRNDMLKMGEILGILTILPALFFEQKRSRSLAAVEIDADRIDRLVRQRTKARAKKDWDAADRIRDQLDEMGVTVEDRPGGAVWKVSRNKIDTEQA